MFSFVAPCGCFKIQKQPDMESCNSRSIGVSILSFGGDQMNSKSVITKTFSVVLFLYLCVSSLVEYLFEPETTKVPWDVVYEWSPSFAIITPVLIVLIMALWGAVLLKIFWNRFVSDIFSVRIISYDEALALLLMVAILLI